MSRRRIADDPRLVQKCGALVAVGFAAFVSSMAYAAESLVPNEPQDIPQWASDNITLPTAVSARSGPLELSPIQAAIARLWQEPGVVQVTFLKPPRFGSTLLNAAGLLYYAIHEGTDVIFYERSEGDAQDFHDKKLSPILENSTSLSAYKRPSTKSGVQDSWTDIILTNGASIQLRSASNDGSFRGIKGRFLCLDETGSKEWRSRGKDSEGSKISIAKRRAQEFATPMVYVGGTPTKVGECMVSDEYSRSNKSVWEMPCPRCDEWIEYHPDVRQAKDRVTRYGGGLRYTVDERHLPNDCWYECQKCGRHVEESEKIRMMSLGRFKATDVGEPGHVGVYTWSVHSTDPQSTWLHIAAEHRKTEIDPDTLQPFMNLWLAQPYTPPVLRAIDLGELRNRKLEELAPGADLPKWGRFVFKGYDVQEGNHTERSYKPGRVEGITYVVGDNRRRAVVERVVLSHREWHDPETGEISLVHVPPMSPASEEMIWADLQKEYVTEDGRTLRCRRAHIDSRYLSHEVLEFCQKPQSKRANIWAIKGARETNSFLPLLPKKEKLSVRMKRPYLLLGTQDGKDMLFRELMKPAPSPGSFVFKKGFDDAFFLSLMAETRVEVAPRIWRWVPITRAETGEMWDCLVYAYAAEQWEVRESRDVSDILLRIDAMAEAEAANVAIAAAKVVEASGTPVALPVIAAETAASAPEESKSKFVLVRPSKRAPDPKPVEAQSRRREVAKPRMPGIW